MNNSLIDVDPCRQYTVSFFRMFLESCQIYSDSLRTTIENCDYFVNAFEYYYVKLIESLISRPTFCAKPALRYRLFDDDRQLKKAFYDDNLVDFDSLHRILVVEQTLNQLRHTAILPMPMENCFYANLRDVGASASTMTFTARASFLSKPFSKAAWYCAAIGVLAATVLQEKIDRWRSRLERQTGLHRVYTISTTISVLIKVIYSSQLKAQIIYPSPEVPFRSIAELTDRLENGELRIIMESQRAYEDYVGAAKLRNNLGEPLRRLMTVLNDRKESTKIVDGMEQVCRHMQNSSHFVFMGDDELLFTKCSKICFWRFKSQQEFPDYYTAFPVRYNHVTKKLADLAVHALPNFREIHIRRKNGHPCQQTKRRLSRNESVHVGALLYGFALIIVGWVLSTILLMIELIYLRCAHRKTYRVNLRK